MLRVLLCCDFAYGFLRDCSAALQTATGKADAALPWLAAWQYLTEAIKDDEGSVLHRKPTNRSNRFDVANTINSLLSLSREAPGPFWCASPEAAYSYIPQSRPQQPFQTGQGFLIQPLRFTDSAHAAVHPFDFLELPASIAKV
jgi:hypothetical protein